jgi:hypothetical protein
MMDAPNQGLLKYFHQCIRPMSVRNVLGVIIGITLVATLGTSLMLQQQAEGLGIGKGEKVGTGTQVPAVVSGDNVYLAWWTNKTANDLEEVMFRASTDGGATFGDKINLSNTTDADSWRVEIAGEGPNVLVSWWETNQTSDTPVARISTDSGETFGPMLMLATNGTLGEAAEEGTEE